MRKQCIKIVTGLFTCIKFCCAQQPSFISQYPMVGNLHSATMSGNNINNGPEVFFGRKIYSIGIPEAGQTIFSSFNYTHKPSRSYKVWHNYNFFIESDKSGPFKKERYSLGYNIHFFGRKKSIMAFGILAGAQNIAFERNLIDRADPIYVKTSPAYFFVYPDVIPSFRYSKKNFFIDMAIHRLTLPYLKQGSKQIGSAKYRSPYGVITFGKKFKLGDDWVCVSNVLLVVNTYALPTADLSVVAYYNKRFGVGATFKSTYSVGAIVQVRALSNLTVGVCYNYALNKLRTYAPSTLEVVMGISPYIKEHAKDLIRHDVNRCPSFLR